MILPFHSLVLCDRDQFEFFPSYECLSQSAIARDLVGDDRRDLQPIVLAELRHRVGLKLSLGQRVVVLIDDLSVTDKQQLAKLADNQGAQVFDLIGHGLGTIHPVQVLPVDPYTYLQAHWKGITVVGDVHGDLRALTAALAWAKTRQHFVWLLGDVIDYGAETLATADLVYHAVMTGTAAMILGNHERKIARWLDRGSGKAHFRISDGNRVTIAALEALSGAARARWSGRFQSLLSHTTLMQQLLNITLVHAAVHPTLWSPRHNPGLIEQFALYGEADHSSGKFRRVHHWIDAIPKDHTVFVGHDVMAAFPIVITGAKGGQVVHLDTGCGTGGRLSTADLRFTAGGLHLECFNRH